MLATCALLVMLRATAPQQSPTEVAAVTPTPSHPHIVFIVSDDLGFNDVSFHGSSQIPTPNLDTLAHGGVILGHYYVQPVCSPTRATFATGRHVIHTGVYDPMNGGSGDLSLNFSLWSDGFQAIGYQTHAIGKWHLGMSSWRFTPLERGFDSYYGYLGGGEDYWTHVDGGAIDLFDGRDPVTNASCPAAGDHNAQCAANLYYSANIFTDRAVRIISGIGADLAAKPLFMYLAYQSVHSPDEAPQSLIDAFNSTIPDPHRRTFAGMVTALDLGVGEVVDALKAARMMDNTLLVFSTDNGGPADNFNSNMACNWPLRGMKRTLFEGGVRGVGFVHGAGISKTGWVAEGKVHAADWFHTLLRVGLLGVEPSTVNSTAAIQKLLPKDEPPFIEGDGVDVWDYLSGTSATSPRAYVLHESHPLGSTDGNGNALRVGDLKIVIRSGAQWSTGSSIGSNDGWYGGQGSSDPRHDAYCMLPGDAAKLYVQCPPPPADLKKGFACEQDKVSACLFNISADPCEHVDLSTTMPDQLKAMQARLSAFRATSVESGTAHPNPDSKGCPYVTEVNGAKVQMPCNNNGTRPFPPAPPGPPAPHPAPPGPTPTDAFKLAHGGKCLGGGLTMMPCTGPGVKIWENGTDTDGVSALKDGEACLKIFESSTTATDRGCTTWTQLHLGVCRSDGNSITLTEAGTLASDLCQGKCVVVNPGMSRVSLGSCAGADGWAARQQ